MGIWTLIAACAGAGDPINDIRPSTFGMSGEATSEGSTATSSGEPTPTGGGSESGALDTDDPPEGSGGGTASLDSSSGGDACIPSAEQCDFAGDEDCDGLADCEDPDCTGSVCAPSECEGGFCDVDPVCLDDGRCAWVGENCAPCPDDYATRNDCWDGDWFACSVPEGWRARFKPNEREFPDEDWQEIGEACALCNTHGSAYWEIWVD